jgi:phosphohistidine phosphatase
MNEQHPTLVLLRHAKAAYPSGVADHDRPLAPRGIREAELAGDWLRANLPTIDEVLCSTATRTRQTVTHAGGAALVEFHVPPAPTTMPLLRQCLRGAGI